MRTYNEWTRGEKIAFGTIITAFFVYLFANPTAFGLFLVASAIYFKDEK